MLKRPGNTLFLTLRVFSETGGIEKVSRILGKSLHEMISEHPGESLKILSMYDEQGDEDEKYFPSFIFKGFGKKKLRFVYAATRKGIGARQVILSHINLLLAGFIIKFFSPKTKLILLGHGIEVWHRVPYWKRYMLGKCDQVLAVSSYTKSRMIATHGINEEKITVLNNCLDPFLQPPVNSKKNGELSRRYGLSPDNIVLITLTRLSSKEQYKGYDNVLHVVAALKQKYPLVKYLVIGKCDSREKARVEALISSLDIEDNIIFTGFIPEDEVASHYHIADLYIMPSKKEGFGIVFIEAMYYGIPVIAGNKDGSVDALQNGKFGLLIDPDDQHDISNAVVKVISNKYRFIPTLQEVMDKFSYPVYKEKLRRILDSNPGSRPTGSSGRAFPREREA